MTVLDAVAVGRYAAGAGWTGNDLVIAISVAHAESGFDTQSHNSTPPDDSYGLWQINMLGNMGPSRRSQFGISSNTQLFDPATNAKAAHMIWSGSGWGAWTTYTSGAYQTYMNGAKQAVQGVDLNNQLDATLSGGLTAGGSGIASGLESTGQLYTQIGKVFEWLATPSNWLRAIEIGLGAALLIAGAYAISKPVIQPVMNDVKSATAKTASTAAKYGKFFV